MTPGAPPVVAFGDRALLAATDDVATAHALAELVSAGRSAGAGAPVPVDEVVEGHASVLVVLGADVAGAELGSAAAWLAGLAAAADPGAPRHGAAVHVLPVRFDGADLDEVAGALGIPVARVIDLVVATELEVAFVGFAPGFPYLTGLPAPLAALPRRPTPRTAVPAGSVAVAGGFAAVYPRATPGGWNLLGRTTAPLFDPVRPPHSRVAPGDRVRFVVAGPGDAEPGAPSGARPVLEAGAGAALEVIGTGLLDLVQDAGRLGVAHLGVPRAGAADARALTAVNLLLGNDPAAAAVEVTGTGPTLRVVGGGHVAVVGPPAGTVELRVDGRRVPDATVVPVSDGQLVAVGRVGGGLRAYLGVAGGLTTPELLGSRSSDVLSGLGPGPLRVGDGLARGSPGRMRGRLERHPASPAGDGRGPTLRVVPGPHAGGPDGSGDERFGRLVATTWQVGDAVDRVGVRLGPYAGPGVGPGGPVASTPMVTGAVQVPPDGRPIVLLPDHATVGGYPVVACVISADLPLLGQLVPGETVTLYSVDRSAAAEALDRSRVESAAAVSGWFPTSAGT